MHVPELLVQFAAPGKPSGGMRVPADLWHTLPRLPVVAVGFHGRWFVGYDWIDCEWTGAAVILTCGNDGADWQGSRWCKRYVMYAHAPNIIGQVTTNHYVFGWADPSMKPKLLRDCDEVGDWKDIPTQVLAQTDLRRFGTWLADEDWAHHREVQQALDWRDWTEGLAVEEVDEFGRVREQRRMGRYVVPKGTQTFFMSLLAETGNPDGATQSFQLTDTPQGSGTTTVSGINQNGKACWFWLSPAGTPGSAAWPGTGTYDAYLDFSSMDSDVEFGVASLGVPGGFLRVNAAGDTVLERKEQVEAAITVPGLHRVTYSSTWLAGAADDRWGFTVTGRRTAGHGNRSGTMFPGAGDDSTSGPWAGLGGVDNPLFFGAGL